MFSNWSGRDTWLTGKLLQMAMIVFAGLQLTLLIPVVGWLVLVEFTTLAFGALLTP